MSRKLLYVAGLITCFSCDEQFATITSFAATPYPDAAQERAALGVDYLRQQLSHTPLDVVANAFLRYEHLAPTARKLFRAYDAFTGILADSGQRDRLNALEPGSEDNDAVFEQARQLSHEFRDSVLDLFFDEKSGLMRLTRVYGVF